MVWKSALLRQNDLPKIQGRSPQYGFLRINVDFLQIEKRGAKCLSFGVKCGIII
jgi:hypothetical protein